MNFDRTCNYKCPSCRVDLIVEDSRGIKRIEKTIEEGTFSNLTSLNELKKALKEADNDGYNNYAKALKLYKEKGNDQKYDISLTDLFDGSKITSRFIYRSISQPSSANYKKDCMEFGKDAFDDLIITVLSIIK